MIPVSHLEHCREGRHVEVLALRASALVIERLGREIQLHGSRLVLDVNFQTGRLEWSAFLLESAREALAEGCLTPRPAVRADPR